MEKRENIRRTYPMYADANVTRWGQMIEKEHLAEDLALTFEFFNNEYWNRMDQSQKIRMIYRRGPKNELLNTLESLRFEKYFTTLIKVHSTTQRRNY